MTADEAPRHLNQMQARIRTRAKDQGRKDWTIERLIANVIVGQMLPPGVVKGGTALKIRVGDGTTRFSRDLDAARTAARRAQAWPPSVVVHPRWTTIYAEAAEGLEVLASVDEAVAWANEELIARM